MNVDYELIGARIKEARREKRMTQENLAEALDVSVGYVSQVERGITKISLDLLGAISGILEKDLPYFVSETSTASPSYRTGEMLAGYEKLSTRDKFLINDLIKNMLYNQ